MNWLMNNPVADMDSEYLLLFSRVSAAATWERGKTGRSGSGVSVLRRKAIAAPSLSRSRNRDSSARIW